MSDTHGLHRTLEQKNPLPQADILVHTGDFTDTGSDDEFDDFNAWLGELQSRFRYRVLICGNHEWKAVGKAKRASEIPDIITDGTFLLPEYMKRKLFNATHVLEHEEADIMGIRFFGSSWCPWQEKADLDIDVRQTKHAGFNLALDKWLSSGKGHQAHRFNEIPKSIDVLLTHGPPRGILDLMEGTARDYGSSMALRESILATKPRAHLFGHVHEQRGCWIQEGDGSFRGGVEYQPAPGTRMHKVSGPPVGYPCQLIACTALKNHNGMDGKGSCLVAPARLILAEGTPGAWSFRLGMPESLVHSRDAEASEVEGHSEHEAKADEMSVLDANSEAGEVASKFDVHDASECDADEVFVPDGDSGAGAIAGHSEYESDAEMSSTAHMPSAENAGEFANAGSTSRRWQAEDLF